MSYEPEPRAPRDELVVDVQQWPVIEAMLADLGIGYNPQVEKDDGLGLARLTDLEDDTDVPIDLDELLAELRHRFAAQRQGLLPLLGKNRFVDTIVGAGHKIMAGGDPQVATEQDYLKALAADRADGAAMDAGAGQGVRVGMVDTRMPRAAIDALGDITVDVACS